MSIDMFLDPEDDPRTDPPAQVDDGRRGAQLVPAGDVRAGRAVALLLQGRSRRGLRRGRPRPQLVAEAWDVWRAEVAFADRFVAEAPNLEVTGNEPWRGPVSLRWMLVHMVEEYARHLGHADLLRQRIDGRVGQ
jgi:hypothetical protein